MPLNSAVHQHPMETQPTQQQQQAEVPVGERWQLIIIGLPLLCSSLHIPSRGMAWETVNAGSLRLRCTSCKSTAHLSTPASHVSGRLEEAEVISEAPFYIKCQKVAQEKHSIRPTNKVRAHTASNERPVYEEAFRWHLKLLHD